MKNDTQADRTAISFTRTTRKAIKANTAGTVATADGVFSTMANCGSCFWR